MRVTANQVTFVRLLLLPVPIAMIYQGGTAWMLGALAVYTLLGLTDAVDGMLARRYGSTPVGALLDPIVDKIFLVAAYGPMADIGWLPIAFLSWIFVRELGVTFLRTIALEEHFEFRTTLLAKLKTTVQMAGAGFALLIWLFPDRATILPILWTAAGFAALPAAASILRGRRPGWRATAGVALITLIAVGRMAFDRDRALTGLFAAILGLTLYTGAEYLWGMRSVLARRFSARPLDALRAVALACVLPFLWLPNLAFEGAPIVVLLGVVAAELAIGGLDNSLAQSGRPRGPWSDVVRATVQGAAGIGIAELLRHDLDPVYLWGVGWLALFVTLSDFVVRLFHNYDAFSNETAS